MAPNLKVIDISHHNTLAGPDSFRQVKASGIVGIIHKASQGVSFIDSKYAARRQAILDAGLMFGGYHFADSSPAKAQAHYFLNAARPDENTLVALDFEPNGDRTMDLDGARAFLEVIEEELGRKAVLYSGNLIKEELDGPDDFFGSHRLWLAQYSNTPRLPAAWDALWLHQFSDGTVNSNGLNVPGITGQVDLNSFPRSDDDLVAEWAAGSPSLVS